MSFSSKDGKRKFGSGFQAKKYDSFHPQETSEEKLKNTVKSPSEPKEESRTEASGFSKKAQPAVNNTSSTKGMNLGNAAPEEHENFEEPRTDEGGESKNPHDVVAEHGKAHTVTVHHDHTANKHHVMSHHADGHMHESEHESAQEAHDEAKQLGSDEGGNSEPENEGDEGNSNSNDLSSIFGGQ
jgi:hypothetical protein